MGIYEQAKALGIEIENHESDLYLPVNKQTRELVKKHLANGGSASTFVNQIDKKLWYDIPFHYSPWWEERMKIGELLNPNADK